jgi:hypothetical protein
VGSLGRVTVTVESFQQLVGELGLIEATSTDDEPAVSKRRIVGAIAAYRIIGLLL